MNRIEKYYKKNFSYSAGAINEKLIKKRAQLIIERLKNLYPRGQTLLDIGSGYGFFLAEAYNLGLKIQGVEPSTNLRNVSINQLIEPFVKHTTFDNFYGSNKSKKYDFICLIHVIEHLFNPKETIKKALDLLNPGGILFIETPNLNSHLFRSEKTNYTFLTPPDHIWIFSSESFDKILKKLKNAKVIRLSTYSQPEHLMGILKRIFKLLNSDAKIAQDNQDLETKIFSNQINSDFGSIAQLKYLFVDKLIAPRFTPLLNIGGYGSILELYIGKK